MMAGPVSDTIGHSDELGRDRQGFARRVEARSKQEVALRRAKKAG
jgi:hypothetical protein